VSGAVVRGRGSLALYAGAFGLFVLAGLALAVSARGFLASLGLLWLSIGLSAAAIVVAVLSAVVQRRS
jgi:hypothetical protein